MAWPERVCSYPWLLPSLSVSWLPRDEQLASTMLFYHTISALESANHGLPPLKPWAKINLLSPSFMRYFIPVRRKGLKHFPIQGIRDPHITEKHKQTKTSKPTLQHCLSKWLTEYTNCCLNTLFVNTAYCHKCSIKTIYSSFPFIPFFLPPFFSFLSFFFKKTNWGSGKKNKVLALTIQSTQIRHPKIICSVRYKWNKVILHGIKWSINDKKRLCSWK